MRQRAQSAPWTWDGGTHTHNSHRTEEKIAKESKIVSKEIIKKKNGVFSVHILFALKR